MTPQTEPRYIRRLRARLNSTGRKSRRLKLMLANELFGSDHPKHLAEALGLMHEASQEEQLTFEEKCRLKRVWQRLQRVTEAPWMARSADDKDPWGEPYPRGIRRGSRAAEGWDALGPLNGQSEAAVPVDPQLRPIR